MTKLLKLDLSHARKVYVVGDIHGSFFKLNNALQDIGFDPKQDHLISVGDLVDRGPQSHLVLDWLDLPWFHAVQGNHEQMLYTGLGQHRKGDAKWFGKLYYKDIDLYRKIPGRLRALPIAIEALLPSGKRIGVLHATCPTKRWDMLEFALEAVENEGAALWDRYDIKDAIKASQIGGEIPKIIGIDHVYYGHTPLSKPLTNGNQSWIDTGACWEDGYFSIIPVE